MTSIDRNKRRDVANFCKINHMCKSFPQVKMKLQGITGSKENALELLGEWRNGLRVKAPEPPPHGHQPHDGQGRAAEALHRPPDPALAGSQDWDRLAATQPRVLTAKMRNAPTTGAARRGQHTSPCADRTEAPVRNTSQRNTRQALAPDKNLQDRHVQT